MYHEMNQKMEEAQQGIFRFKKLNAMLEELYQQKNQLEVKSAKLKAILDKESLDVEKLEGKSLNHLFYSILGNLDEKKGKEQQEVLAAQLKYDQAVSELEQINAQISLLSTEASRFEHCQKEYDTLYKQKSELLLHSKSRTAMGLLELNEKKNEVENNRREIEEAIWAGEEVLRHTEGAMSSLESAEGWGTWDLLGGGLLADIAKHSHIDDAKNEANIIQVKLSNFRAELADVRIKNEIHFETDGFGKFADFFFDGLIADWCMQSRIEDSLGSVQNMKEQVEAVLLKLKNMESIEKVRMGEIMKEINQLIIEA
ncbi:MAG: hypothetical protein PHX08_05095 [Lachnospiraceae bacterium]|nr:hypothetical protein [Lachnospiraceae bacterium]